MLSFSSNPVVLVARSFLSGNTDVGKYGRRGLVEWPLSSFAAGLRGQRSRHDQEAKDTGKGPKRPSTGAARSCEKDGDSGCGLRDGRCLRVNTSRFGSWPFWSAAPSFLPLAARELERRGKTFVVPLALPCCLSIGSGSRKWQSGVAVKAFAHAPALRTVLHTLQDLTFSLQKRSCRSDRAETIAQRQSHRDNRQRQSHRDNRTETIVTSSQKPIPQISGRCQEAKTCP